MLFAFVEHFVIEGQTGLIGLFVVAVREDPPPVDGKPEAGKAHLREQSDILRIAVIEIDRLVAGIERGRIRHRQKSPGRIHIAPEQHIRDAQSFAVRKIRAFALIARYCAAP